MTLTVIRKEIGEAPSALDEIASAALVLVLHAATVKNVALRAVIRLAAQALADIEGHDATSQVLAALSRRHAERAVKIAAGERRRR